MLAASSRRISSHLKSHRVRRYYPRVPWGRDRRFPVGAGEEWMRSGDACVALVLFPLRNAPPTSRATQASPPPIHTSPAPTESTHPYPMMSRPRRVHLKNLYLKAVKVHPIAGKASTAVVRPPLR